MQSVYAIYLYKRVSPSAARAREQPIVTVFSIDAGSSREGFTSCLSDFVLPLRVRRKGD
jgi:hypothetical protein